MGAEERREEDTIEEGDEWLTCAVQSRLGRGRGSCYMQYRQRCGKGACGGHGRRRGHIAACPISFLPAQTQTNGNSKPTTQMEGEANLQPLLNTSSDYKIW